MTKAKLTVDNMSCQNCVKHVTKALGKLPGVTPSEVSIGGATVEYDPASVTVEQITAALTAAGYPARSSG